MYLAILQVNMPDSVGLTASLVKSDFMRRVCAQHPLMFSLRLSCFAQLPFAANAWSSCNVVVVNL
jgi:hypothetical protein